MKQKKFGKKVQNWHQPLHPSAFSQRYLRLRRDANLNECLSDSYDFDDCDCWDWGCDCCDPVEDPYVRYKLAEVLSRILDPINPLTGLNRIAATMPSFNGDTEYPTFESRRSDTTSLENRLAEHVEHCLDRAGSVDAMRPQIIESVGDWRNLDAVKLEAERLQSPGLAKLIIFFSPFWVRSPMTWKQDSGVTLLDHLFVLYEVPAFLSADWHRQAESDAPEFKWLCWFILLAQGGSLKRAAARFNWSIPDRFQHYLRNLPADLSPTRACIFAEVLRLGGNENDFRRICSYETFVIDPTAVSRRDSGSVFWMEPAAVDADFWRETVRWLIANREAITDENSFLILSWAMHEYTEAPRRWPGEVFSWKRRSARAVIERSLEYHNRFKLQRENYTWQSRGWDWTMDDPHTGKWSFAELTSSEELFRESQVMNHCVYTYGSHCASGYSAIVSVKRNDAPCLTIEINLAIKRAVQIRGAFNRAPHPEEQRAVNLWISSVVCPNVSNQQDPTLAS